MTQTIHPSNGLNGTIQVPYDKSICHRAVMLCAIADGVSEIHGFQTGDDCMATVRCMRKLGVRVEIHGDKAVVYGKGFYGLSKPDKVLDVGNSGTTIRLLSGILAWQPFSSVLTGDASLLKRPMGRIIEPLTAMGADISGTNEYPPLNIKGKRLSGIEYKMPVASAQVKSTILLAGLNAAGSTIVHETEKTRTHTEIMLKYLGADISVSGNSVTLKPNGRLSAANIYVPGDFSSAAYFIVAALITPNSRLTIKNVGINNERIGLLDVLRSMGGDITVIEKESLCGEPVADITVKSSRLTGTNIDGSLVPRMIDEIPIFAVAAAFADGASVVKGAGELKIKESDRIHTVKTELSRIGANITETDDGFIIKGTKGARLSGGGATSHRDHRVAMSLAVAGFMSEKNVTIEGSDCVAVSYPNFFETIGLL